MTDQSGPDLADPPSAAQPPVPGMATTPESPRRPWRRRPWLAIAAGAALVIITVLAMVVMNAGSPIPPPSPTGPSACVRPGNVAKSSRSWKFALPRTLCGLVRNNTAPMLTSNRAMVEALQGALSASGLSGAASPGYVTSSLAQAYQLGASQSGIYRSIAFVGLKGRFGPAAAVATLGNALQSGAPLRSVPAGPHGGAMRCALVSGYAWQCVWATTTTVGEFQIIDTTGQLTGRHIAANAVRIRDAIEVRA